MPIMSTPTLVVVPGSFSTPKLYLPFQESLLQQNIQSQVVRLPSVSDDLNAPPKNLSDDSNEIIRVVEEILDQDKEVVVMTHSYGGMPASQSLKQLSTSARRAKGLKGGVEKIIYVTSVIVEEGVSNFDQFGGNVPEAITINGDYMSLDTEMAANGTFSDLPYEERLSWARQMSYQSTTSFEEKLAYAGYNDVNCYYVVCEADNILPPEYQYSAIEILKKSTEKDVGVHKMMSDHAPTISHKDELVSIIKQII